MASTGEQLAARFRANRATWRALVAKVPPARMGEPGPMGEWSFKDTVSHLAAWRSRTIGRMEAAVRGEPRPGNPWPADLNEDDPINDWFRRQAADRSVEDLLAEYDASFERMAAAVAALPAGANPVESDTPGYYRWNDASGPLESDFFGHLAGHVDDVEAWLAGS
jgi:Mycothiol maleylpyruvate isomerase N-terminal domain.